MYEKKIIGHIGILDTGQVQIREDRVIMDGTEEVTRLYHRTVIEPGDDISTAPEVVQKVCAVVWTKEIVEAFEKIRALRNLQFPSQKP